MKPEKLLLEKEKRQLEKEKRQLEQDIKGDVLSHKADLSLDDWLDVRDRLAENRQKLVKVICLLERFYEE